MEKVFYINIADNWIKKLVGLLGTKVFPDFEGLFLPYVTSIHTFFMKYSIDIIFLDENNNVKKIVENVKPFRVVFGNKESVSVLEMPAGAARKCNINIGDKIVFEGRGYG